MNLEQLSQFEFSKELYKKFDIRKGSGELISNKKELIQLVNTCIFGKYARTSKEKYEVLELRDKLLKLIRCEINNSMTTTSYASNSTETYQQVSADSFLIGNFILIFLIFKL